MKLYKCSICGYEIDVDKFEKLKDDWKCMCGASKKKFKLVKDSLEESIEILHRYNEGTPPREVETD